MGWFWADSNNTISTSSNSAKCPADHSAFTSSGGACPVTHKTASDITVAAVCPVKHDGEGLNPLNNMPNFISSSKLPGQRLDLPTQRTISTIPRGEEDGEGYWEYPSAQQMFAAMMRKNKGEGIPEDAVESMLDVHNFLNEGAWQEILDWEKPYIEKTRVVPRLQKFTGKPHDLSPRARLYSYLSKVFPSSFDGNPPFDRHDWTVLRNVGVDENGHKKWQPVRYVIDYYGGPDDDEDVPSFFLDVRPALDNVQNGLDRWRRWSGPIIEKGLGHVQEEK